MATLILSAAVGAFATSAGWGSLATIGAQIGAAYVGGAIDQKIFGSSIQGPRLANLNVQTSTLGTMLPIIKGEIRIAGNMIWSEPYFTYANTTGGKGGGGGSVTQYTYSQTMAIAVCQGPIVGIRRIWATGRLIYDAGENLAPPMWATSTAYALNQYAYNSGNLYVAARAGTSATSGAGPTSTSVPSTSNVTISIASPAVVGWPAHGLVAGTEVVFGTSGTLPTGVTAGTIYWVIASGLTTNSFEFSATPGGAAVDTSGTQSGTQACTATADITDGTVIWQYVGTYTEDQAGIVVSNNAPAQTTRFQIYQGTETQLPNGIISAYMQTQPNTYYFAPGPLPVQTMQVQVGAGVIEQPGGSLVKTSLQVTGEIPASSVSGPTTMPAPGYHMAARVIINKTTGVIEVITGPFVTGAGTWSPPAIPVGYYPCCWVDIENAQTQINTVNDERVQAWLPNTGYGGTNLAVYRSSSGNLYQLTVAGTSGSATLAGTGSGIVDGSCTWDYVEAYYPIPPLPTPAYRNTAYVVFVNYSLTATGNTTPNWEFQVVEATANCGDLVTFICEQAGLPSNQINTTTIEGIPFDGFVVTTQSDARSMIEPIASSFFFDPVESDGAVKFVKRGGSLAAVIQESDLAGHDNGAKMPDQLQISRIQDLELPLILTVQYPDENDSYLPGSKYHRMQGTQSRISTTVQLPIALTDSNAQGIVDKMINVIWNERDTFDFVTGRKWCFLEPTDIVAVEKGQAVYETRLQQKDESGGLLTWKSAAEDIGLYSNVLNNLLDNIKPPAAWNTPPGSASLPLIIDAPGRVTMSGFELWMALGSPNANWGGCVVYVSTDNINFTQIGTMHGNSTYGTGTVAAGSDPDTVDTLVVNVSPCAGLLDSVPQANADNFTSLCFLGVQTSTYNATEGAYDLSTPVTPELVSYENATMVGQYGYDLTYLRRGVYGTLEAAHTGAQFAYLGSEVFKYAYNPIMVGQKLYFKFPSFNTFGGTGENIGDVSSYAYTIGGSISYPSDVTGFSCGQNGANVVFQWNPSPDPINYIAGFEFRYVPLTLSVPLWSSGLPITKVTKGTSITTAKVPPGSWTLMACEVDISGNYSVTPALFNMIVINENLVVLSANEAPDWLGTTVNMVRHWTGVIYPDSSLLANMSTLTPVGFVNNADVASPFINDVGTIGEFGIPDSTVLAENLNLFNYFSYNPFASFSYTSRVIDSFFVSIDRAWTSITGFIPQSGAGMFDPQLEISTSDDDIVWSTWQPWTIGSLSARYYQFRIDGTNTIGNTPVITGFTNTVDNPGVTQNFNSVAIPITGYALVYPQQFHNPPLVTVTSVGAGGYYGEVAESPLPTGVGCTIFLYSSAGVKVAGTANISAIGN